MRRRCRNPSDAAAVLVDELDTPEPSSPQAIAFAIKNWVRSAKQGLYNLRLFNSLVATLFDNFLDRLVAPRHGLGFVSIELRELRKVLVG
jgi:hypothetical protein